MYRLFPDGYLLKMLNNMLLLIGKNSDSFLTSFSEVSDFNFKYVSYPP